MNDGLGRIGIVTPGGGERLFPERAVDAFLARRQTGPSPDDPGALERAFRRLDRVLAPGQPPRAELPRGSFLDIVV